MKQWFNQLSLREKRTVVMGSGMLVLIVVYFGFWAPLQDEHAKLEASYQTDKALYAWMESQTNNVKALRSQGGGAKNTLSRQGQSLLGLVDSTARKHTLGQNIKRIQPSHNQGVQIWLDKAPFDKTLLWIAELEQYNVAIDNVKMRRDKASGYVNVELIVKDKV